MTLREVGEYFAGLDKLWALALLSAGPVQQQPARMVVGKPFAVHATHITTGLLG